MYRKKRWFPYCSTLIRIFFFNMIYILINIPSSAQEKSPLTNGNWYQEAMTAIQEEEYVVTWQKQSAIPGGKAGYHMVNREQELRLYFYPEGIKVVRRKESKPSWVLGWTISGIGRGGPRALSKPTLSAEKNRLEYNRGDIVEQYENMKSGIQARLSIKESPKGLGPVNISILLDGDATPRFASGASEIEFYLGNKALVGFTDIKAQDANGKNLPLKTSLKDKEFLIQVEDHGAAYPILAVFLLRTPGPWTAESNVAEAEFGKSVCTAGDVNGDGYSDLIIGADAYDNGQNDEGCVYVYYGSPTGPGSEPDWSYESDNVDAHLGYSVSTAGDVNGDEYSDVIIGAATYTNDQAAEGAALVFYGSSSGLGTQFSLLQGNSIASGFGCSVSCAGDVNGDGYGDVIVGAENQFDGGAAYVFKGSADGIVASPFWDYSSYYEDARLGNSVRTAGDVNGDGYGDIIVGSVIANNGQSGEGKVYVYYGGESDMSLAWHYESNMENWFLGSSVSTAGDVNGDGYSDVIVGVTGFENGEIGEGAVYIFHGSSTGLSASPDLILEPNVVAIFGNSVSTAGDMDGDGYADIIVGAHYYSSNSEYTYEGAAYVFRGSKNGLGETHSWFQKGNQAWAEFGYSVSTAGDVNGDGYSDIIVGAPFYDNGENREGKCFLYYGKPLPPSSTADWYPENAVAKCEFATSVAGAGDVNGDGYSDIMVGAYLFDNGQDNEGRVFIYHGRGNNVPLTTANRILEPNIAGAYFGDALAAAGDINADGYDDIVIGAVGYNNFEGRVYAYYGSSTGIGTSADWVKEPNLAGGHFGSSVSGAGDVNGDGYMDIIIGMPSYPNGTANGRAYVYHGTPTGLTLTNRWNYICGQEGAFFGTSVAFAGDVNRDGYSDVIIGATGYSNGEANEGAAYVFYGSHNGVSSNSPWIVETNQEYSVFGQSVSTAGDVNGDGYSDVIIGAPFYDNDISNEGAAFIYPGGGSGLSKTPIALLDESNQENARFGYSVAGLGDVNADGFSDVIVGAYLRHNNLIIVTSRPMITKEDAGSAYIYLGSPTGPSNTSDWSEHFLQTDGNFGKCVAGAGDVNGDGFADVIIGAPGYSSSDIKYGRAYLYLGGGGNGRLKKPNQGISSDRTSRLGRTETNLFTIGFRMTSPFGRGKVNPEWEHKVFGTPLDGTNTSYLGSWKDLTTGAIDYSYGNGLYDENILIHWRVRLCYDPVTVPYQSHGPWITIPWNGIQEADFRTGPNLSPTLQDIINYLLGKSHYQHDINADGKNDAADVVEYLIP